MKIKDRIADINDLAQFIRTEDGNHTLGAGALAELIVDKGGFTKRSLNLNREQLIDALEGQYVHAHGEGGGAIGENDATLIADHLIGTLTPAEAPQASTADVNLALRAMLEHRLGRPIGDDEFLALYSASEAADVRAGLIALGRARA